MRIYIISILLFFTIGCKQGIEKYLEECPYEIKYTALHHLTVPITMIPHQKTYQVGDTLTVQLLFDNNIYDLTRDANFIIEDFPFEPVNALYMIEDESWHHGYRLNQLLIDEEKFNVRYNTGESEFADDMRGFTIYEDGWYHFEYQLVLESPGVYISLMVDQYRENKANLQPSLNDKANAVQFEGRCPDTDFRICNVVEGDPHYHDFLDELIYLDKVVYQDNLSRIEGLDEHIFDEGRISIDWAGFFCFEVVE